MKVMRAVDVERAHEVNIVLIEVCCFEERAERVFDKSDALLGRVDLVRFLLVDGYLAVPNISFVLRGPLLHICKLFLRDHALPVKDPRRFL